MIRYFQASFIGFNFAALTVVYRTGVGLKEIGTSAVILLTQYTTVCIIAQFIIRKKLEELNSAATKSKFGNLYLNLDTRIRSKVLFGMMFFVQRLLLVPVLAFKSSFSLQWQLSQAVLLINTAYILTVKPYSETSASLLDMINCSFLLIICVTTATNSDWNTNASERFRYGMGFDCVIGLQFIVNILFAIGQLSVSLSRKAK